MFDPMGLDGFTINNDNNNNNFGLELMDDDDLLWRHHNDQEDYDFSTKAKANAEIEETLDSYLAFLDKDEPKESHEHVMCIKCCAVYAVAEINEVYTKAGVDPKQFKCQCGCAQVLPMAST